MSATARIDAAMGRIGATLEAKRQQRAANHSQAPIAGAFVADLRREFGADVAVTYVSEGDFVLGGPERTEPIASGEITVARADKRGRRERELVVARWVAERKVPR